VHATGLLKKRLVRYVAQELSRLPATHGKETSHGNGSLPLWEVRLEGVACQTPYYVIERRSRALTLGRTQAKIREQSQNPRC
jgi:hypothetical protein